MPELPEVETVRRGLTPVLEGARLSRVRINRPDLRFPFPERFVERRFAEPIGLLDDVLMTSDDDRADAFHSRGSLCGVPQWCDEP